MREDVHRKYMNQITADLSPGTSRGPNVSDSTLVDAVFKNLCCPAAKSCQDFR